MSTTDSPLQDFPKEQSPMYGYEKESSANSELLSADEKFTNWLESRVGRICSGKDILYLESYKPVFIERLKAAYVAGAASVSSRR